MSEAESRVVPAVHGRRPANQDAPFVHAFAEHLRSMGPAAVMDVSNRFATGASAFDELMRAIVWKAMTRACGNGLRVGRGVAIRHAETFEIGDGVFIGDHAVIHGRFDGTCVIGDYSWIGPQSFLDARNLVIEERVGWGPGARVLGSTHTGMPVDVPIIDTELEIKPVRIRAWADIGVNAVILPGVTVGRGAIVGAGAVVTSDVPDFAVVAGVPARVIRYRTDRSEVPRE
jgi:acetyltransferase-like isoleucine patch superfamily enzyme